MSEENEHHGVQEDDDASHEMQKSAGSTAVLIGARIGSKVFVMAFRLFVVRMFGASAYGAFAFMVVVVELAGLFSGLGLDRAMLRYGVEFTSRDDVRSFWALLRAMMRIVFGLGVVVSCVMVFCGEWIALYTEKPHLASMLRIVAPAFPLLILGHVGLAALQARQHIKVYGFIRQVLPIVVLMTVFGLVFLVGGETASLPVAQAVAWSAPLFGSLILLRRLYVREHRSLPVSGQEVVLPMKEIWSFSLGMVLFVGAFPLVMSLDRVMIGLLLTNADVGIYDISAGLSIQVLLLFGALCTFAYPKIGAFYGREDMEGLRTFLGSVTRWSIILTTCTAFGVMLLRTDVMALFGRDFLGSGTHILFVLCASQWVHAAFGPVSGILTMTGKERILFLSTVFIACVNAALNVIMLDLFGVVGAAYATICAVTLWNSIVLWQVVRLYGFAYHKRSHFRPALLGLVLFGVFEGLGMAFPFWWARVLFAAMFGAVYLGLIFAFELQGAERALVWKVLARFGVRPR